MPTISDVVASVFRGSHKEPSQSFDDWAATATQDQVLNLFLELLRKGDTGLWEALSDKELAHFKAIFTSITGKSSPSPDAAIAVSDVLSHLAQVHQENATLITAASKPLAVLLLSHAYFPFKASAEPVLTYSSLQRAVAILTKNSDEIFKRESHAAGKLTVRKRAPSSRVNFIFASLASALPVAGSVDDVLDVLCRVPYPRKWNRMAGQFKEEPMDRLAPVAERLCQQTEPTKSQPQFVSVTELRPLADLMASLNGEQASGKDVLQGKERLDSQEFESWATEVDLMSGLDKLFACFLRDRDSKYERP